MIKRTCFLAFYLLSFMSGFAQKIATLEVTTPVTAAGWGIPVSVALDSITDLTIEKLSLTELGGKQETVIPCQISGNKPNRVLHWLIQNARAGEKRLFKLSKGVAYGFKPLKVQKTDNALTIQADDKNLVNYFFKAVPVPEDVDKAYERTGFIHPLYTPFGQVLTRIQPKDHYHHYGIWNPWTHVLFEKDTIDFWNLKDRKGTVRFARFGQNTEGVVFAEYEVMHEHVVLKGGKNKVALNELQTVRVYRPSATMYLMDITAKMQCATKSPFHILAYRYGGMGWRATEEWTNTNSEVRTSEGKTRRNADSTRARWWFAQGKLGTDYGGAGMLSHPSNFNHPEPLRIWPENQYNRGDMFGMFAPTKDKDWVLEPDKSYTLRYRWVVFSNPISVAKMDAMWAVWANPPTVFVNK
jgi:hypothetical protein